MDRKELKQKAKSLIKGKTWEMFVPLLVTILIEGVLGALSAYLYIPTLLMPLVGFMHIAWTINYIRTQDVSLNNYFGSVKSIDWDLRVVCTIWLSNLFIVIGSLLLLIPGIIFSFSFAMIPYIMADSQKYSFMDAIKLSNRMMKGHKMEYFVFCLSFIGWEILIGLTCGILGIWKGPYIQTCYSLYFEELKKEYELEHPGTFDDLQKNEESDEIIDGEIIDEKIFD